MRPTSRCIAAAVFKTRCFATCVPYSRQWAFPASRLRGAAWCHKPWGRWVSWAASAKVERARWSFSCSGRRR
eukprot:3612972-Pleurochrysis_carterae.AAC.1